MKHKLANKIRCQWLTARLLATAIALLTTIVFTTTSAIAAPRKEQSMDELWGEAAAQRQAADIGARGAWFSEAKYAMFVHWGLYSGPAGRWQGKTYFGIGEWLMSPQMADISKADYARLAENFNPQAFDARALVQLAVDAGMRYLVITAKHHDGFAMYDSASSTYDIADASPFARDPLKELAAACQEAGIGLGFYYSQYQDWYEQGSAAMPWSSDQQKNDFSAYFDNKVLPQVSELLTEYGPVALIWFDTPGTMSEDHSKKLVELVRQLQPNTLINSRIGNGMGDYSTLGDAHIATVNHSGLWETVDTTNDSWAFAWYDQNWKSDKEIAGRLVTTVARGGNYMLNVGPDGDGLVPLTAAKELRDAGKWLSAHKEAVYGTTASPWGHAQPWGDVTVKGNALYLHVLQWPQNGTLSLAGLKSDIKGARLLNHSKEVIKYRQEKSGWVDINLPFKKPDTLIPVIKLELQGAPRVVDGLGIDSFMPTVLHAELASCDNCKLEEIRWMEKFGEWKYAPSLVAWQDDGKGSWEVTVRAPGQYRIEVEYSANQNVDFSEWMLRAEAAELIMQALDSGERELSARQFDRPMPRYRTVRLGVMNLKAGKQQISIAPVSKVKDGGIKLHALYISPLGE